MYSSAVRALVNALLDYLQLFFVYGAMQRCKHFTVAATVELSCTRAVKYLKRTRLIGLCPFHCAGNRSTYRILYRILNTRWRHSRINTAYSHTCIYTSCSPYRHAIAYTINQRPS